MTPTGKVLGLPMRGGRAAMAALAVAALGMTAAPTAQAQPIPREYVRTDRKARRFSRQAAKRKHRARHRKEALHSQDWKELKGGWFIDGRGDLRSPKRLARRALETQMGQRLSGRQWVRIRKALRRAERAS